MKRPSEEDKIYYDITIDHNPDKKEDFLNLGSKAITEIRLKEPLIENPEDYMLAISKFKIDTSSLPNIILEMKQPQKLEDVEKGILTTNYWVEIEFDEICLTHEELRDYKINDEDFFITEIPEEIRDYDNKYRKKNTKTHKFRKYLTYNIKNEANIINKSRDESLVYINNTHEQCFYYKNLKNFLIDINTILNDLSNNLYDYLKNHNYQLLPIEEENINLSRPIFFIEDGTIKYNESLKNLIENREYNDFVNRKVTYLDYITHNVRKLVLVDDENYDWITVKKVFKKYEVEEINYYNFKLKYSNNLYEIFGKQFEGNRYKDYFTLRNFEITPLFNNLPTNFVKAIIIGSDTLPVTDEYLPIAINDGFLTHYKTDEYQKALKDLGIEKTEIRDIFNKVGQRILDIYYPLSVTTGDIRTSILFSRENMEEGQNITLIQGTPIQNFNIWVKWIDIYGNLYDLYLWEGNAVDIRLCFLKKHITKSDIAEGFAAILDALPKKKEKKELKPNGKPNRIVVEGADNHGFVHF